MKKADRITGVFLLALSVYIALTGISLDLWWGDEGPGPGFLPFFVGICLALLSLMLIWNTFKAEFKDSEKVFSKKGFRALFLFIGSSIVAGMLVKLVGMVISMGLLAGFLVTVLSEKKSIVKSIGVMIILPIMLYFIFQVGLDVPFPKGIIGI